MLGNVYGLRLLRDPAVRDTTLALIAGVLAGVRLLQLTFVERARLAYDFVAYWIAAGNLLAGRAIYTPDQLAGPYAPQAQGLFLYAPPLAALVTPFYRLSPADVLPAAADWSGLAALVAGFSILALSRDGRLGERFPALAGRRIVLLLVAAFALPEVIDELINGNVHLYLLGLFTLAWLGVRRGDSKGQRVAGIAIGIATVIKVFPGLAFLWFLVTRRWTAALWTLVGAATLSVVTLPITGIQPWLEFPTVLANLSAPIDPTASFAPTVWLTPILGFSIARIVVTAAGVAIVVWSAARQTPSRSFAVTVLASVLITPALWSHYLSLIVMPLVMALGSGVSVAILGLDYILLSAGAQTVLGDLGWITARAMPTAGALLLLAVLLRPGTAGARTGIDLQAAPSAA